MKKIFITMLAVCVTTASFAQNPKIGKEIKATKDYTAGKAILDAQFANLTDEDKGKAYDELYKLAKEKADPTIALITTGKTEGVDYKTLLAALETAYNCEKYASKDAKKNVEEISPYRTALINAANIADNDADKLAYSLCYVNTAKDGDAYVKLANFFASYALYQQKDYTKAAKFAKAALGDEKVNDMAEQVYRGSMEQTMKTREDSLNYVKDLKAMNIDKYFVQICNIYQELGQENEVNTLVEEALAKNPNNKIAYFTRASINNAKKQYDAATVDFKKAVEIDPSFIQAWFNLGVCASQKGFDLNEKYTDKTGRMPNDKAAEVTAVLKEAITYYEKVRELDPNHEQISNWPMQLRMLYNAIGEKAKADEISKMLGDI
ncbi:MAG: hypothetical protein MSA13_08185 [Prevotella sp.]|nr:hypothetical protein [Prevotella sp.]